MRENRTDIIQEINNGTTMETEVATTAVRLPRAHGCSVNRPDNPGRTTLPILHFFSKVGQELTTFFLFLMLIFKKFHQYLTDISRGKLHASELTGMIGHGRIKPISNLAVLHRASQGCHSYQKNVTLKPCLHSIFNQREEDGGLWFL